VGINAKGSVQRVNQNADITVGMKRARPCGVYLGTARFWEARGGLSASPDPRRLPIFITKTITGSEGADCLWINFKEKKKRKGDVGEGIHAKPPKTLYTVQGYLFNARTAREMDRMAQSAQGMIKIMK